MVYVTTRQAVGHSVICKGVAVKTRKTFGSTEPHEFVWVVDEAVHCVAGQTVRYGVPFDRKLIGSDHTPNEDLEQQSEDQSMHFHEKVCVGIYYRNDKCQDFERRFRFASSRSIGYSLMNDFL